MGDLEEQGKQEQGRQNSGGDESGPAATADEISEELSKTLSEIAALFTPEGALKPPRPANFLASFVLGRVRRRLYAEFGTYLSHVVELLLIAIRLTERVGEARRQSIAQAHAELWEDYKTTKANIYEAHEAATAAIHKELEKIYKKFESEVDPRLHKVDELRDRFANEADRIYKKAMLAIRYIEESRKNPSASHREIFEEYAELTPQCYIGFDQLPEQGWRRQQILDLTLPPAVEVGCSDGGITAYLNEKGKMTVGIDVAVTYLVSAREPGLYVAGDGRALPFLRNSFETVILAEILEHVREPREFIREALRVARRRIVVTMPESSPDPTHLWEVTAAELPSILESEFSLRVVAERKQGDFWVWAADKIDASPDAEKRPACSP